MLKDNNRNMRITKKQLAILISIIYENAIPTAERYINKSLAKDGELRITNKGHVIFK